MKSLLISILFLSVMGCTTHNIKSIDNVKKVAIIGFNPKVKWFINSYNNSDKTAKFHNEIYNLLNDKLENTLHWDVMNINDVITNPEYLKYYPSHFTSILQSKSFNDTNPEEFLHALNNSGAQTSNLIKTPILTHDQRNQLMSALGVDSIIILSTSTKPSGTQKETNNGESKYKLKFSTYLTFDMYSTLKESIWSTNSYSGEQFIFLRNPFKPFDENNKSVITFSMSKKIGKRAKKGSIDDIDYLPSINSAKDMINKFIINYQDQSER